MRCVGVGAGGGDLAALATKRMLVKPASLFFFFFYVQDRCGWEGRGVWGGD